MRRLCGRWRDAITGRQSSHTAVWAVDDEVYIRCQFSTEAVSTLFPVTSAFFLLTAEISQPPFHIIPLTADDWSFRRRLNIVLIPIVGLGKFCLLSVGSAVRRWLHIL